MGKVMGKFERAYVPEEQVKRTIAAYLEKWETGDDAFRKAFPAPNAGEAEVLITAHMIDNMNDPCWRNERYQVVIRECECQWGDMWHLSIKRNDRQPLHDWRDLQEIKNQLIGPEHEGIELYPAESRRVDTANQYHIWVLKEKGLKFPFGFEDRLVTGPEDSVAESKQRPFDE